MLIPIIVLAYYYTLLYIYKYTHSASDLLRCEMLQACSLLEGQLSWTRVSGISKRGSLFPPSRGEQIKHTHKQPLGRVRNQECGMAVHVGGCRVGTPLTEGHTSGWAGDAKHTFTLYLYLHRPRTYTLSDTQAEWWVLISGQRLRHWLHSLHCLPQQWLMLPHRQSYWGVRLQCRLLNAGSAYMFPLGQGQAAELLAKEVLRWRYSCQAAEDSEKAA